MFPLSLSSMLTRFSEHVNNRPSRPCQSCIKNSIGFDSAVAKCFDCDHLLCAACLMAHENMLFFRDHLVINIIDQFEAVEFEENTHPVIESLSNIEKQIHNTFEFCQKVLITRRDSLLKQLHTILTDKMNNSTNCLQSIQFDTNLFKLKLGIHDTFGSINFAVQEKANKSHEKTIDLSTRTVEKPGKFDGVVLNKTQMPYTFRTKMQLKFKFGGTGLEDNRFTEPNGVAIDGNKNIVVADSNSNYMKVFDSHGNFQFKFGIDKLLFPNKVACHKETGRIVVIERKPAHEIKIFDQSGKFICRFGSGMLRSPRGVFIDRKSRIIILESKVMRVLIFSMSGELLTFFDVSKHFKFANSICASNVEDKLFISDNHSHCIKVFNYQGEFLKTIGGVGLTNYPTSVAINSKNQILVTDNYNSFNLTILTEDGELVSAFESKIKHSRILDAEIINDDTLMFSSRDNNIYFYTY